jgi:ATP-dependent Clp protease ATP-binding subunit ClpX
VAFLVVRTILTEAAMAKASKVPGSRRYKGIYGEQAPKTFYCSFCLKSQHEVAKLVAGRGLVMICDACVGMCQAYIDGRRPDLSAFSAPKDLPTERLIAQLPGLETTVRGKRTQLQWVVDELRRREVSWADIGQALGVSRQSAWERFS